MSSERSVKDLFGPYIQESGGEGGILPLADYGSLPSAAIAKTAFLKGLFD
jgi:hypothetical protein